MDTKTTLSSHIPSFMHDWRNYKRGLKGLKFTDWIISSDYCLDDKNKPNDVITFTIFPRVIPRELFLEIDRCVPADIKNITHFSEETLNYLKHSPYFFNISILLENRENFCKKAQLIKMFEKLISIYKQFSLDMQECHKDDYRRIQKFAQYLKQGNCSKKLLSTLLLVTQHFSVIVEFLLIKEKHSQIFWCSDRDSIISFNDGIIFNFVRMCVPMLIKGRIKEYNVKCVGHSNEEFLFDPFIRIPDIITGALSSLIPIENGITAQQPKHIEIINQCLVNNNKMIHLIYDFDKNGKPIAHRAYFEAIDKYPLLKYN
jgi:hypothetical protein